MNSACAKYVENGLLPVAAGDELVGQKQLAQARSKTRSNPARERSFDFVHLTNEQKRTQHNLVGKLATLRACGGHADAQVPQCRCPDRAVAVRVGIVGMIVVAHRHFGEKTAAMHGVRIVTPMPGPDMRRTEHHGGPVVAGAFVHGHLAIALLLHIPRRVGAEIGGMPVEMMTVFVINDAGVVARVMAVRFADTIRKRTAFQTALAGAHHGSRWAGDSDRPETDAVRLGASFHRRE